MLFRWPVLLLTATSLVTCAFSDQRREYEKEPAPDFLFERRPVLAECWKSELQAQPGTSRRIVVLSSPPLPYMLTREDRMTVPHAEVPALTITAEPSAGMNIRGGDAENWSLRFCAMAEGQTESEAAEGLQRITLSRMGGVVSVAGIEFRKERPAHGTLVVNAPAHAPIIVNGSYSSVSVYDMRGPVRVSTTHARVTVLGTKGQVDATGAVVDFAGDRGQVRLSADAEINLKMTATRFDGTLEAWAQRPVRLLLPPGFASSIQAVVGRSKDFVCRADICSQFKRETQHGLYIFTYGREALRVSNADAASKDVAALAHPALHLRSEGSTVVIDSTDDLPKR